MVRHLLFSLILIPMIFGCGADIRRQKLNGTGSTQVAPIFEVWSDNDKGYKKASLSYIDVGSGTGTDLFLAQDYDFFCSEIPLNEKQKDQAKKNGINLVGFPLAFSAVVPVYNLEKVKEPLVFSGKVLADIFLGKVVQWNDPAIKALNPKAELPDEPIRVVVRSDPSGTSYVFTKFLSHESEEWLKAKKGALSVPHWTDTSDEKLKSIVSKFALVSGSKGVIKALQKEKGTLSFLGQGLARKEKLQVGRIKVKDSEVEANSSTIQQAIKDSLKEIPSDLLKYDLPEKFADGAYPVIAINWIYFNADPKSQKYSDLAEFIKWAIHDGQDTLESLSFFRIPANLVSQLDKSLSQSVATVNK